MAAVSFDTLTSALASTGDAYANKPMNIPILYKAYGLQGLDFYNYMLAIGGEMPCSQETVYHFEEERYFRYFSAGNSPAAPGVGADITVKLAAADIDADGNFFPKDGDVVDHLPTQTQYKVVSHVNGAFNTASVTLRPAKSATNIGFTSGDDFAIQTAAFAENTGQPETSMSYETRYSADLQIIKETASISGTEMTNAKWFDQYDTGTTFQGFWSPMQLQTEFRLKKKEFGALFWGQNVTNTADEAAVTNGLQQEMETRSYNLATADYDWPNFTTIDKQLIINEYYGPVTNWLSFTRYGQIRDNLSDYFKNENIERTWRGITSKWFGGVEGGSYDSMTATMDWECIIFNGRPNGLKRMYAFDDPANDLINQTVYQDFSFVLPMGGANAAKTGEFTKYITTLYKALGGYSRRHEMWQYGTAGPGPKIGEIDSRQVYHRSHIGLKAFMLNRAVLIVTGT